MRRNNVGLVEEGSDDVRDTVLFEQSHDVFHHWLVHQRDHRLGGIAGEGTQTSPESASHYYRFHSPILKVSGTK
jgi:hypothetical protein